MIEKGNLSEFNQASFRDISACNDAEFVAILSQKRKEFPKIYLLLTETTKFYTERFSDLQDCVKREKRLISFETPSRVLITHEYTIEGVKHLSQGFYFLFNTKERLSWLKIYLENNRASIASRSKIVSLLIKELGTELEKFSEFLPGSKNDIALRLYEASDGKPCFVEYNQKEYKGQQSLLFSITFFDSIRYKRAVYKKKWYSFLQEKKISYNYSSISGDANAWIYFKSPNNFVLSLENNAEKGLIEVSPSNDEEIASFVLTPKGGRLSIDFEISVNVPCALRCWYLVMSYLSLVGIIFGASLLWAPVNDKIIKSFCENSYALIAALIATRGWLISEEQVMKLMSIFYTTSICLLIAIIMALSMYKL